jgi:glycosyltransferase involved in cell wall biosynthesis
VTPVAVTSGRPPVVALVAAKNEEPTIAMTVKALLEIPAIDEVVVVADGSEDRTAEEARSAGAAVLAGPRAVGKGGAVEAALRRTHTAGVYVLVDGDVGESASEAERLVEEVLTGRLDLAVGILPIQPGGGFGLVKRLARWCIRSLTGFDAAEPLSGQRAVRREVLDGCRPLAARFGVETAMTIDALRLGYRVGEVDVDMTHRPTGRGLQGFRHRAGQGLDILAAVVPRFLRLR